MSTVRQRDRKSMYTVCWNIDIDVLFISLPPLNLNLLTIHKLFLFWQKSISIPVTSWAKECCSAVEADLFCCNCRFTCIYTLWNIRNVLCCFVESYKNFCCTLKLSQKNNGSRLIKSIWYVFFFLLPWMSLLANKSVRRMCFFKHFRTFKTFSEKHLKVKNMNHRERSSSEDCVDKENSIDGKYEYRVLLI